MNLKKLAKGNIENGSRNRLKCTTVHKSAMLECPVIDYINLF